MTPCSRCDAAAPVTILAVRLVDGEFLDSADLCRSHALELAMGRRLPLSIPRSLLDPLLHDCAHSRREMQRTNLVACWQGCGRFADVWITAGTEDVVDDLDRGVMVCGRCVEENEPLPLLIRDDLRAAAALVGK